MIARARRLHSEKSAFRLENHGGGRYAGGFTSMSAPKQENVWLNLGFNVVVPSLLLAKGKAWLGFSPHGVLIVALAFPVGYFLYDLWKRRKCNWISVIGFLGVLLTGGIGLLALDKKWVVVKETSVPLLIALFVVGSIWRGKPLARLFLYNEAVFDTGKIDAALTQRAAHAEFERLLVSGTWLVALSFFVSALLNGLLALWIIQSPAGTDAFNEELGRMLALSYPVIMVPCIIILVWAMLRLGKGLTRLTGLSFDDCLRPQQKKGA